MKFANERPRTTTERTEEERHQAASSGLIPCGKESNFFRGLELGEERKTSVLVSTKNRRPKSRKVTLRGQWWANYELVRLNRIMIKHGLSRKLRAKALLAMVNGKPLPAKVDNALAEYTENVFAQKR